MQGWRHRLPAVRSDLLPLCRCASIRQEIDHAGVASCECQDSSTEDLSACSPQPVGHRTTRAAAWLTRPCPSSALNTVSQERQRATSEYRWTRRPLAGSFNISASSSSNVQLSGNVRYDIEGRVCRLTGVSDDGCRRRLGEAMSSPCAAHVGWPRCLPAHLRFRQGARHCRSP